MNTTAVDAIVRIELEPPLPAGGLRTFAVGFERLLPHFVAGPENSAVQGVFQRDFIASLAELSPIVFYGPHSSGKTALAYTLQCRWEKAHSQKKAVQFTSADFSRHLVGAIAADDMSHFREKVRKASSLFIDSIEDIASKTSAQDELTHVIDDFHERGLPVFVTSTELPQTIRGLRKSLSSRLAAGLQVPTKYPSKAAILSAAPDVAKPRSRTFDEAKVLENLVQRLPEGISMPAIRGMLLDLLNSASRQNPDPLNFGLFSNSPPELPEDAKEQSKLIDTIIKSRLPQSQLKAPQIARAVSKHSGCSTSDMRGSSRKSQIVLARSLAMYLCRKLASMPLEKIGTYFGGRDHTTVMHAVRKMESLVETDAALVRLKSDVLHELNQSTD